MLTEHDWGSSLVLTCTDSRLTVRVHGPNVRVVVAMAEIALREATWTADNSPTIRSPSVCTV